ncbi:MAG: helix-turn-helix domain-containing protein [Gammaproteobacteria bacterium]|nr:helix-turn-helix domain-containing protein [Gammaproteobacteria bacterium]
MADKIKSKRAQRALDQMGDNLKTARLKRRMAVKDFAGRVGVSTRTITRLEKGDDGVSIGTLAMACLVLGEIDRISDLLDPASDGTGLLLERNRLPKRIRVKRRKISNQLAPGDRGDSNRNRIDDEGVGF